MQPKSLSYDTALQLSPTRFAKWVLWKAEHDRPIFIKELAQHEAVHRTLHSFLSGQEELSSAYADVFSQDRMVAAIDTLKKETKNDTETERTDLMIMMEAITMKTTTDHSDVHGHGVVEQVPFVE